MSRIRVHAMVLLVLAVTQLHGQTVAKQSTVTIHVHKSGLLSGFGHNHTVVAPVSRALLDARGMSAEIVVFSKEMKVTDVDVSEKDRAEIQATMLGPKVLYAEKFPEIRFKSSRITKSGPQSYRVSGVLELHGISKEISLEMTGGPGHYEGKTRLKQTDYGIQPVSVAGGTVKVKDELDLDFDIYTESAKNAGRY